MHLILEVWQYYSYLNSLQNNIWNLPDRSTILSKFIYDKEGKLAVPTRILPVRVRGPALILKTVLISFHLHLSKWMEVRLLFLIISIFSTQFSNKPIYWTPLERNAVKGKQFPAAKWKIHYSCNTQFPFNKSEHTLPFHFNANIEPCHCCCVSSTTVGLDWFNSTHPGQYGRQFADDIFKCIFFNEKFCILLQISLKFVPKCPINNTWALVQVMAWCLTSHYLNQWWHS